MTPNGLQRIKAWQPSSRSVAIVVGAAVGCVVFYMVLNTLLLTPARDRGAEMINKLNTIAKLQRANSEQPSLQARLDHAMRTSFGADKTAAKERMRSMLMDLLEASKMRHIDLADSDIGNKKQGAEDIGWKITAYGELANVVTFLHMVSGDSHLHRLENLSVSPASGGEVVLNVRYATLVLDGAKAPTTQIATSGPASLPASEKRREYDVIAARDILRPYVKRRPAPGSPAPVTNTPGNQYVASHGAKPSVASLTCWDGKETAIDLCDSSGNVTRYKLGDCLPGAFGGGRIAMVDYRPLPKPDNPQEKSPSRLILEIDSCYWAVELGQSLDRKRQLPPELLPAQLAAPKPEATSLPAGSDRGAQSRPAMPGAQDAPVVGGLQGPSADK
jgi:hypothetical protein